MYKTNTHHKVIMEANNEQNPWRMLLYALGMVIAFLVIMGIAGHFERILN